MISLRIGGVPEHFNLPWHLLLEAGEPAQVGVDAHWQDFPDGSGAMAAALREDRLDVGVLLTEGAVAGVAGGGLKIVSLFTESPLIWGVHVPATSNLHTVAAIRGLRYAISRRGSGSHLMSFVHAREQRWPAADLDFVVVGNLKGAVDAFESGKADVFFWEKFMTKPLVDAGRFRRVGEFSAPWPAFVVCVSLAALGSKGPAIAALLGQAFAAAARLAASSDGAARIAARYGLEVQDVRAWLAVTRWAARTGIGVAHVAPAVDALRALDLVDRGLTAAATLAPLPST
jgi:ABC-type nitrate/sulfonate/bicarbonate transport system substrate-binding protein